MGRFLHSFSLLLVLLIVPCVASGAPATATDDMSGKRPTDSPFLGGFIKQTTIVYPLQVGDWKAVGEHLYEQQEAGVSVRYASTRHGDRWLDVYFYPAGILSQEKLAKVAETERQGIISSAESASGHGSVDMGQLQRFTFEDDSKKGEPDRYEGYSVDLAHEVDASLRYSAMALLVDQLYFVKGRFSLPKPDLARSEVRKLLERFIAELTPALLLSSTGECWRPLPVTKLEPLSEPPKGMQGTVNYEGKPAAYIYADHIATYDPESPIANVALMMVMAEHGRYVPGCVAPEMLNRSVEGDMREIRLEYGTPGKGGDGQRRPGAVRTGSG